MSKSRTAGISALRRFQPLDLTRGSPAPAHLSWWGAVVYGGLGARVRSAGASSQGGRERTALALPQMFRAAELSLAAQNGADQRARRSLWGVWLRGRCGLTEGLPKGELLLVGRVAAIDGKTAREVALQRFARDRSEAVGAATWRWLGQGDHFAVRRC